MKKILVACGSEWGPSTKVAKKVGTLCKQNGISCATVQCTVQEVKSKARAMRPDVIIGFADLLEDFDVPVLSGLSLMDGSESNKTVDALLAVLES
jgi:galactitol-specific phosphotransferase system IIB component